MINNYFVKNSYHKNQYKGDNFVSSSLLGRFFVYFGNL